MNPNPGVGLPQTEVRADLRFSVPVSIPAAADSRLFFSVGLGEAFCLSSRQIILASGSIP